MGGDEAPEIRDDPDRALARLAEVLTQRLQAGDAPDVEDIARRHPAQAAPIRGLMATLNELAELGRRHARGRRGRRAGRPIDPDAPRGRHEP